MNGLLTKTRNATPAEQAENKRLIAEIMAKRNPDDVGREVRVVIDRDCPTQAEEYPDRGVGVTQGREGELVKVRFSADFIGKNEKGRREQKTRKKVMWIPHWLLVDYRREGVNG